MASNRRFCEHMHFQKYVEGQDWDGAVMECFELAVRGGVVKA